MKQLNSYYLLLTYLALRREATSERGVSAEHIRNVLEEDIRHVMHLDDINVDIRTIRGHIDRLMTLSEYSTATSIFQEEVTTDDCGDYYFIHEIDQPSLRLLADVIVSSKLLSSTQSEQLLDILYRQHGEDVPRHFKHQLQFKQNMPLNRDTFLAVETIAQAIDEGKKVRVTYLKYNERHELVPYSEADEKNGRLISPHYIVWTADYYYVLCTYEDSGRPYFLRLDRMRHAMLEDQAVKPLSSTFQVAEYVNAQSNLFSGELQSIRFVAKDTLLNRLVDSFGKEAMMERREDGHLNVTVRSSEDSMYRWFIQHIDSIIDIDEAHEALQARLFGTLEEALDRLNGDVLSHASMKDLFKSME